MNYEQFINAILECAEKKLLKTEIVEKQKILKNNGVVSIGLTIRNREKNAAPIIYLEEYFQRYCQGEKLEALAEQLINTSRTMPLAPEWEYQDILDFQKIRHRIAYKLINAQRNEKLLEEIPNLPFFDLAVVFYVMIPSGQEENCSVLIRNVHMDYWKLPISLLYQCAQENTPRLCPYVFRPLADFIREHLREDMQECPLCILSNQRGIHGAAAILYPKLVRRIYEFLGGPYYLLPSSIHEFLILPENEAHLPEELEAIVRNVNEEHIAEEELLSDHVYYFDGDNITKI